MMLEDNKLFDKSKLEVEFAEKLRKENPTQLTTLIKMHLSFLLDVHENEPDQSDKTKSKKTWLMKKKKASICTSSNIKSPEGPFLSAELVKKLKVLMSFLEKDENLSQEGIFRKTGSVSRQQELKFLVHQLKPLELDEFTCHDVASVLKSILADLPEPLLTETYFSAYSQVADFCNATNSSESSKENQPDESQIQCRIMNSLQLLCWLLPTENRTVLDHLITLLHKAAKMESTNKMTAVTLATLFTPHLICPKELKPEDFHKIAETMTKMVSFMITNGSAIFLVPERLSIDIKNCITAIKRRRETPEKILDESISDSVANTVYTFVDREKTAQAHVQNSTDTALAQLYAHIQSLPESSRKKKLIKQFNKQNGQGTPLQFINRDKSACRSIGDSIKKHIFHKTLHKTPKRDTHNTPSAGSIQRTPLTMQNLPNKRILFQSPISLTKTSPIPELKPPQVPDTPSSSLSTSSSCNEATATSSSALTKKYETELSSDLKIDDMPAIPILPNLLNNHAEITQDEMIDDEDFCSSDEEDMETEDDTAPVHMSDNKAAETPVKKSSIFKTRLMKGVSLGNLKFPFHSSTTTPRTSPKMKKSKSSSILIDIEKDDEKRKLLMKSATESFDSEESDLFFSMCDATKEQWHVDVSNINYFLNQTEMQDQPAVRNSMSPITKSTQRMPKSMQESIMTPRSRKPVMLAQQQNNISQLLEESEEMSEMSEKLTPQTSAEIPLNSMQLTNLQSKSDSDISSANDNGLPVVGAVGSNSSSTPESLSSAFKDYFYSRGNLVCEPIQDDDSFSSQPDDFESSAEYQKLSTSSSASSQEMDKIINQSHNQLSESLLYCLDGNITEDSSSSPSPAKSRKRQLDDSKEELSMESMKRPLIENEFTDL